MKPLQDKVAIVTGSSRGIGRAIAQRLGQDGAHVVVTYVGNKDKAEEVARGIESGGSQVLVARLDVRDLESVRALFKATLDKFGKLDILVNNAAGVNVFKPTTEMSIEEYDSMFLVTRGVYFALQEAAKYLSDRGRIISISSAGHHAAMPGGGAYAGAKRHRAVLELPGQRAGSARHHGQHAGSGPDRHRRHGLERGAGRGPGSADAAGKAGPPRRRGGRRGPAGERLGALGHDAERARDRRHRLMGSLKYLQTQVATFENAALFFPSLVIHSVAKAPSE
jgi:hypothetical protein